ncbi:MAG: hypothetical protein AB1589_40080 [Cyanobacteriota bacterium]
MAGSRKWMLYRSDSGREFAVNIDESNGEAAGFTDAPAVVASDTLPRGITMRYVNCVSPQGVKRKIWVGQPNHPLTRGGNLVLPQWSGNRQSNVNFSVTSFRAEKRRVPFGFDTGINDDDAT